MAPPSATALLVVVGLSLAACERGAPALTCSAPASDAKPLLRGAASASSAEPILLAANEESKPEQPSAMTKGAGLGTAADARPRRRRFRGVIAYALWFFFGMSGAHHLYLGRNREALLCSLSCGGFGLGWLADAWRIPRYLRELARAEAGPAACIAGPASDDLEASSDAVSTATNATTPAPADLEAPAAAVAAPSAAVVKATNTGSAEAEGAAGRLGCMAGACRLVFRLAWRLMFGAWLTLHAANLTPDRVLNARGVFRRAASAAIYTTIALATVALTTPLPAALPSAPIASSSFTAASLIDTLRSTLPPTPADLATVAGSLVTVAGSLVTAARSAIPRAIPTAIAARPKTVGATLLAALCEATYATSPNGRGTLPLLTAVIGATLPTWRQSLPHADPPKRSLKAGMATMGYATLFWVLALLGALNKFDVAVTVDGSERSINALRLLGCSMCAARPDRFFHMLRTLTEHMCIKRRLEGALNTQFERLCVLPQTINRCFDWDVAGTRWQRVGLSLPEAYAALGVSRFASSREIKAAYRQAALANHPDKVDAPSGSAAAEEAAMTFMKAQKAYDRIMESRKPPSPPPPTSPAPAKQKPSYYYGGSTGYRDQKPGDRRRTRGRSSSSSSSRKKSSGSSQASRSKPRK